jgi:hypothetical protein
MKVEYFSILDDSGNGGDSNHIGWVIMEDGVPKLIGRYLNPLISEYLEMYPLRDIKKGAGWKTVEELGATSN